MARVELLPPPLVSSICHEIVGFFFAIFLCALAVAGAPKAGGRAREIGAPGSSGNVSKIFPAGLGVCFVRVTLRDLGRSGEGDGQKKKEKTVADSSQHERAGQPLSPEKNDGPRGLARA